MRVVLDTNVLVGTLLVKGGTVETVWRAWVDGRFEVLVAEPLLAEVLSVLRRPKIGRLLTQGDEKDLLEALGTVARTVDLVSPYPSAPDSKDDFLLALVRDGDADVLVTGDKALVRLGEWEGVPILRPADFVRLLARE